MVKHGELKKLRFYGKIFTGVILSFMLFGCAPLLLGSGKSATTEDTGFFSRYDDFKSESDPAFVGLPDLYSIRSDVNWGTYKKVIMPDFTSLTVNVRDIQGMQLTDYKTIKKDLPDQIAQAFDGSVFIQCIRSSERIDPRDIEAIKKLPADAILMGNIKEIHSLGVLTVTQVEIKIVDIKTGMEILKALNRSSTDRDKVAMPIVRNLSVLIKKAKSAKFVEPEKTEEKSSTQSALPPPAPNPIPATAAQSKETQPAVIPAAEPKVGTKPVITEKPSVTYLITTKSSCTVRSEPNGKSKVITTLKRGQKLKQLNQLENWYNIILPSGEKGWIHKDLVKTTD